MILSDGNKEIISLKDLRVSSALILMMIPTLIYIAKGFRNALMLRW